MFRQLAPALVAPLLVASACATQSDQSLPHEVVESGGALAAVQSAPDAAAEAGSARFEMTMSFDTPEGPVEMLATGGYDGDRMAMEMDFGSILEGLDTEGEALPPGFDEPMQVVTDGGTFYLRLPILDALTGTSGWLSASPGQVGSAGDALGLAGAGTHPGQLLETLRGVSDDLEELGQEEVRGVATSHHRGTIRFADVIAAIPEDQRAAMEQQLGELGGLGVESLPFEVWIDGDGLVRRLLLRFDGAPSEGPAGMPEAFSMTLELFDYGEPVDIELPPPDEVSDLSAALPGLLG